MNDAWIADRMRNVQASGIRKAFDLSKRMTNPINLSIGLPDFDVPDPIKHAACDAINAGDNAYTLTTGLPDLRNAIQSFVTQEFQHIDREAMVTSGTAGGLMLAICATVDPGDEVILFDPYFVMYNNLVAIAGGVPVIVDTYPDFRINIAKVAAAITPKTKCVLVNSPGNPTGVVISDSEMAALVKLCREREILLISDEVYRTFCYDGPFTSAAAFGPDVLVVDGFSKAYGMTGWRLGFAHGPARLIQEMAKLQQFSFVCAPAPLQRAVVGALDLDLTAQTAAYRGKRDRVVNALADRYDLVTPTGAFYAFPAIPKSYATASDFIAAAVERNLLIIPGNVFSQRDTHFRISFAVADAMLEQGLEVLRALA